MVHEKHYQFKGIYKSKLIHYKEQIEGRKTYQTAK